MKMSNYNKNEDFDEDKISQISDELELENEYCESNFSLYILFLIYE